jgi:hypothetical protein
MYSRSAAADGTATITAGAYRLTRKPLAGDIVQVLTELQAERATVTLATRVGEINRHAMRLAQAKTTPPEVRVFANECVVLAGHVAHLLRELVADRKPEEQSKWRPGFTSEGIAAAMNAAFALADAWHSLVVNTSSIPPEMRDAVRRRTALAAGRRKANAQREADAKRDACAAFDTWQQKNKRTLIERGILVSDGARLRKYLRTEKPGRHASRRLRELLDAGELPTVKVAVGPGLA